MLNLHRTNATAEKNRPLNKLKDLITNSRSQLAGVENSIIGCESFSVEQFDQLNSAHDAIAALLSTNIPGCESAQVDAMATALMTIADTEKLSDAMSHHLGSELGNESFDSENVVNNMHLTVGVAGQVAATKTDADFLFPKVVVDQKTTNYSITASRTVIEPKFYHATGGAVTDWGKLNLLDAAVKDDMLRKEMNVFVPELNSNSEYFANADYITPWKVTRSDGVEVTTSFLSGSQDTNLVGISTSKGMEKNQAATILDRIDEGAKVSGLVLAVGDVANKESIYLNTLAANHSTFTKSQTESESNVRGVTFGSTTMMLSLTNYVKPKQFGKEIGGFSNIADIAELKALVDAGYTKVGFKVSNSYTLDLSDGTFTTTVATPVITYIEKSDAVGVNAIESAQSTHKALLDAVKATYLATDVNATLSNATLKLSGDQIGSQDLSKNYTLSVRTPVEIRKDVLSKLDDAEGIKMLSQALTFRRDDETVAELHDWFNWAEANLGTEGVSDSLRKDLDIVGLHWLLKPYVKRIQINLDELLKEEDTTSKLDVLEVGLVTRIQDELVQMVQETNLRSVLRTHGTKADAIPGFGVYGDSRLTSYIMRTGEDRTLGDGSTIQSAPLVHPTDRINMRDTLYIMPRAESYSNEKDRVLGFGHAIEITPVVVKRARDNGIAHDQVQIWPIYTNIVTNPMLLRVEVEGLDQYFQKASADKVISA